VELFWYQWFLSKTIISFCEMVKRIENRPTGEKAESLARRSVDLLVVGVINVGTLSPTAPGYWEVWSKAQSVC
jgi:hypothetical protein